MTDDADLDALDALAEAATPGRRYTSGVVLEHVLDLRDALKSASAELRAARAALRAVEGLHRPVQVAAAMGTAPASGVYVTTCKRCYQRLGYPAWPCEEIDALRLWSDRSDEGSDRG